MTPSDTGRVEHVLVAANEDFKKDQILRARKGDVEAEKVVIGRSPERGLLKWQRSRNEVDLKPIPPESKCSGLLQAFPFDILTKVEAGQDGLPDQSLSLSERNIVAICMSSKVSNASPTGKYVEQAAHSGERIDRAERQLFAQLLELGLTLLRAFVDGQGD
ncbi:MAG: hypothetical protein WD060_02930, partial [Pirellulales bacterium]